MRTARTVALAAVLVASGAALHAAWAQPAGIRRIDLQRHACNMQYERHAGLGETRPDRIEIVVPRRAAAAGTMRHPRRLQAELQDVLDFCER